jgi:hypothetical protein
VTDSFRALHDDLLAADEHDFAERMRGLCQWFGIVDNGNVTRWSSLGPMIDPPESK